MTSERRKIVIIGGGFGGIRAAKQLRSGNHEVTLIDRTNHHLFQPLLYQVATAALSPGDIAVPIRAIFNRDLRVLLGEAVRVDTTERTVVLKDGRAVPYDRLILAPGSQYNYFGNDDWEQHAPGLKTVSDALQLRERILVSLEEAEQIDNPKLREPYLTFVIIGGGPTGVEMAGAIAEIAKRNMMRDYTNFSANETRIFLVEMAGRILNGYPESLSEYARESLEEMGVRVLLNTPVTDIGKNRVSFGDGAIHTPNIIWAAGVAASPLLNSLEAEQDKAGRVKVNPDLSVPGHPEIFVVGDAMYLEDEHGEPLPALAPVAIQQGEFVGRILASGERPGQRPSFSYTDKGTMATIGRARAVAKIWGLTVTGFPAWLIWSFVHILFLIGFRNRFRVFVEWTWFYFTFKRGVRLITSRSSGASGGRDRQTEEAMLREEEERYGSES